MLKQPLSTWADSKRSWLICLLLGILGAGLFAQSIRYGFVNYDDDLYVYQNRHVVAGLSLPGVKYALTTGDIGTWAPLTWLSYETDISIQGPRASSFHTTNVLLHGAAGALLCLALLMMRQSTWISVTVAALFLMHPLRVESVAWIAERKDVLCAFFWMLGLVAYASYVRQPDKRRWTTVFLCFAAGLMSKMTMVTFPFVLLLLDYWPLNRLSLVDGLQRKQVRGLILEKLPFFATIVVALVISATALHDRGAFNARQSEGLAGLLRVPQNYVFYLTKIFWPANLSVLYPIKPLSVTTGLACLALLGVITLGVLRQIRTMPWLSMGWLWFIGTLVPMAGFVAFGDFAVADRYTYISSVGLIWAIAAWAQQAAPHRAIALWGATTALVLACGILTTASLPRWKDSLALYDAALRVGPHYVTYNNRGVLLLKSGQTQAALTDFNAAIELNPRFSRALNNRGSILSDQGQFDQAIKDFDQALKNDPFFAGAYENRGNAMARKGEPEQALADYARTIKLDPDGASHYNNRAAAYFQLKQFPEAKADIERCRELGGTPHPGLVQALMEATTSKP